MRWLWCYLVLLALLSRNNNDNGILLLLVESTLVVSDGFSSSADFLGSQHNPLSPNFTLRTFKKSSTVLPSPPAFVGVIHDENTGALYFLPHDAEESKDVTLHVVNSRNDTDYVMAMAREEDGDIGEDEEAQTATAAAFHGGTCEFSDCSILWTAPYNFDKFRRYSVSEKSYTDFPFHPHLKWNSTSEMEYEGTMFVGATSTLLIDNEAALYFAPGSACCLVQVTNVSSSDSDHIVFTPLVNFSKIEGFHKTADSFSGILMAPRGKNVWDDIWILPSTADRVFRITPEYGNYSSYSDWPKKLVPGNKLFMGGCTENYFVWLSPYEANGIVRISTLEHTMGAMDFLDNWPVGYTKPSNGGGAFAGCVSDAKGVWLVPFMSAGIVRVDVKLLTMTWIPLPDGPVLGGAFKGGLFNGTSIWLTPYNYNNGFLVIEGNRSLLTSGSSNECVKMVPLITTFAAQKGKYCVNLTSLCGNWDANVVESIPKQCTLEDAHQGSGGSEEDDDEGEDSFMPEDEVVEMPTYVDSRNITVCGYTWMFYSNVDMVFTIRNRWENKQIFNFTIRVPAHEGDMSAARNLAIETADVVAGVTSVMISPTQSAAQQTVLLLALTSCHLGTPPSSLSTLAPLPVKFHPQFSAVNAIFGNTLLLVGLMLVLYLAAVAINRGPKSSSADTFRKAAGTVGYPYFAFTLLNLLHKGSTIFSFRILTNYTQYPLWVVVIGFVFSLVYGLGVPAFILYYHTVRYTGEYKSYQDVVSWRWLFFDGAWGPNPVMDRFSALIGNFRGDVHRGWCAMPFVFNSIICIAVSVRIDKRDTGMCIVQYYVIGGLLIGFGAVTLAVRPLRWWFLSVTMCVSYWCQGAMAILEARMRAAVLLEDIKFIDNMEAFVAFATSGFGTLSNLVCVVVTLLEIFVYRKKIWPLEESIPISTENDDNQDPGTKIECEPLSPDGLPTLSKPLVGQKNTNNIDLHATTSALTLALSNKNVPPHSHRNNARRSDVIRTFSEDDSTELSVFNLKKSRENML